MSSQYINIGGSNDQHYRYKMERMRLKTEGRGKGTKTVVVNMLNIAKNLKVLPEYPTKYFGNFHGSQSKYDTSRDVAIVNGEFDQQSMEDALNDFINKFVLCVNCSLPEVFLSIDEGSIVKTCQACGHVETVNPAIKLCKYILNNPPPKYTMKKKNNVDDSINEAEKNQKKSNKKFDKEQDDEAYEFETDTSEEAVRKRMEEEQLSNRIREMTLETDKKEENEEDDEVSPQDVLRAFLKKKSDATNSQLYAALNKIKNDYGMQDKHCVSLFSEVMMSESDDLVKLIEERGPVIKKFLKGTTGQKLILSYLDEYVGVHHPESLVKTSLILEKMYDQDLIQEEVVIEWSKKKKSKFVKDGSVVKKIKQAAQPFIQWLESAEEED